MSFIENHRRYLRFARTSRDVMRDACAIERPMPRGHRWVVPACLLAGLVVLVLLAWEHL